MRPFMIRDRRIAAFDITNADDLKRLEAAYKAMAEHHEMLRCMDFETMQPSEIARLVFGGFQVFFAALFPGREEEIVGKTPSVACARQAFGQWTAYLCDCMTECEQMDEAMRRLYLGDAAEESGNAFT